LHQDHLSPPSKPLRHHCQNESYSNSNTKSLVNTTNLQWLGLLFLRDPPE
jgi:hypothetical protein